MIGDGTCHSECYTEECGFDRLDCGCAPHCTFDMYGNCDFACLLPECGYDDCWGTTNHLMSFGFQVTERKLGTVFDFARDCAPKASECYFDDAWSYLDDNSCASFCEPCAHAWGTCFTGNNYENCDWGYGANYGDCIWCDDHQIYSYCTDRCTRAMPEHPGFRWVCYPATDTSAPTTPDAIYVTSSASGLDLGTRDQPYYSLSTAFAQNFMAYTTVYLLRGTHELLPVDQSLPEGVLITDAYNPLVNTFTNVQLTVTTLMCSGSGDHAECADQRATVHLGNLKMVISVKCKVTFDKVIIDGKTSLVAGCTNPQCYYCPNVMVSEDGESIDDRGDPVTPGEYANQSLCAAYLNFPLFVVTATGRLVLSEVDVVNIRHQPSAVIRNSGGEIEMRQVDFREIVVGLDGGAVIKQDSCASSYTCGSLYYAGGTVSYLNNGYEYVDSLSVGGFLAADGLRDITFVSVVFTKNISVNPKESAVSSGLISLQNFRTLTIASCSFTYHIVKELIVVKAPNLQLERSVDGDNTVADYAAEHFYIRDSVFGNNVAELSLISTAHSADLQNFKVQNSQFRDNLASNGAVISMTYTGKLSTDIKVGQLKTVALPSGSKVQGFFSPRHVTVLNSVFLRNLGVALFALTNLANIAFSDSTVFTGNGASDTLTYNDIVIDSFIADVDSYLKNRYPESLVSTMPCLSLLSVTSCYSLVLSQLTFNSNYCNEGPAGPTVSKLSGPLSFSSVQFIDNKSISESGAVASFSDIAEAFTLSQVTFSGNENTNSAGVGIVKFGAGMKVTVNECRFLANKAAAVAGIHANDVARMVVTASTFEGNTATHGDGGAIGASPGSGTTQYSLEVVDCRFAGNSSLKARGGGLFLSSTKLTRPYKVKVSTCTFTSNAAGTMGAAVFIDTTLVLSGDSEVKGCTFVSQKSEKGTVAVLYSAGTLAITGASFSGNQAKVGAGVASTTQSAALLAIADSQFNGNTAGGGVVALTDADVTKSLVTSNCQFSMNTGNAVSVQNGKWTDTKSTFTGTVGSAIYLSDRSVASLDSSQLSSNVSPTNGGACYILSASTFKCTNCSFSRNSAKDKGGALFLEQSSSVVITGSSFDSNTCGDKGSAVFMLGSLSPVSSVTMSTFTGNVASNSGVISLLSSALSLVTVTVDGNTAKGISPGVVMNLSTLSVKSSTFANQNGNLGTFVYATSESIASFSDTKFTSATAQSGGAFNIIGSSVSLTSCRLSSIKATSGAGFIAYSQSNVTLVNVTMTYMTAADSAIGFISEGTLSVTGSSFMYFDSGGIQADKLTSAVVSETTFAFGDGVLGGGFTCTRCQTVNIHSSTFHRNSANWGGGLYLATSSDALVASTYQVEFTVFSNNTAWRGAGVYSNNVNVKYNNCTFLYNSASKPEDKSLQATGDWGRGGGAMADCKDVAKCVFNFALCYFAHNTAEVSGGGVAWQDIRPNVTGSTFVSNYAVYGNDVSSFAVAIQQMTPERRLQSLTLTEVASGQEIPRSLVVALVDHYGGVVTTDNSSSAEIVAVDPLTTTVSGITKVTAVAGIFTFDKFIITAEPETSAQVKVQTSAIDTTKAEKAMDSVAYAPAISITAAMRECVLGESHVGKTCQVCEAGKYSLDPNSTACTNCPAEAICYGNYTMVPRTGYWRARVDTDVFYKCFFSSACTGSPEPPAQLSYTGDCASGYTGNLCQACTSGYSRSKKYECAKCPDQAVNIVRLVFISIAVAILAAVMVATTMKSARRAKSLSSIYIKILMNYLQIVILAASFNLSWPSVVIELFSMQETAGSFAEQAFSVDCFLAPEDGTDTSGVVYQKLIVMAAIPVLLAVASVLAWVLIYGYKHNRKFPTDGLIATIVILLFLAHPTLTKYLFNIFTCMEVDGQYYLLQQLDVKCWDSTHVFYITTCALPAIILWVLGIPAVCLYYLVRNKRRLSEMAIRIRLGFLFNGYRPKAYYWEFVILYRKILIICCSVFLTTISIPVQALCVLVVVIVAMYMQDQIQPFTTKDLNDLELKSIMCATVTIYCGLFYLTGDISETAQLFLFAGIVLVNTFFVWHWVKKMFGFYISLAINRIPFLRRRLGAIRKVNDGLDEDLFVRKRHIGAFLQSAQCGFTPMVKDALEDLRSMKDMYLMKLRFMNSMGKFEDGESGRQTPSAPNTQRFENPFLQMIENYRESSEYRMTTGQGTDVYASDM